MALKVVVFEDLVASVPAVAALAAELGGNAILVGGGREALTAVEATGARLLLLDVAMPQMSGIECCRRVKESYGPTPPHVYLLASVTSETVRDRATEAGCDGLFLRGEVETGLIPLVRGHFSDTEEPQKASSTDTDGGDIPPPPSHGEERRDSRRVEIPCPVEYSIDGEARRGHAMNASAGGILFAASEEIAAGSKVEVRFTAEDGEPFELPITVIRVVRLKEPLEGLGFAVGGKFVDLTEEQREKMLWLRVKGAEEKLPPVRPDVLNRLMDQGEALVMSSRNDAATGELIGPYVGALSDFETWSLSSQAETALCTRRLTVMRMQCRAFTSFVPTIGKNPGTYAAAFLPVLSRLLASADAIEEEADGHIRKAVEAEEDAVRLGMVETCNALYEAKVQMLLRVEKSIVPEGLGPNADIVIKVRQRVEQIRTLQSAAEPLGVKFDRRTKPEEKKPKEDKKKKKKREIPVLSITIAGLLVLVVGIGIVVGFLGSRVPASKLELDMEVIRARKEEVGITIVTTEASWHALSLERQEMVFGKIADYCRENRLRQAKIVTREGKRLAALVSTMKGNKREFEPRRF